jgi:hypothetical protein
VNSATEMRTMIKSAVLGMGVAAVVVTAAAAQPYYPYYYPGYGYSYPGYNYSTYNYPTYGYPYVILRTTVHLTLTRPPATDRRRRTQTLMSPRDPIRAALGRRRADTLATDR